MPQNKHVSSDIRAPPPDWAGSCALLHANTAPVLPNADRVDHTPIQTRCLSRELLSLLVFLARTLQLPKPRLWSIFEDLAEFWCCQLVMGWGCTVRRLDCICGFPRAWVQSTIQCGAVAVGVGSGDEVVFSGRPGSVRVRGINTLVCPVDSSSSSSSS
ncbi:hypothetical protein BJX66DRAFT_303202 [Aspergillus keveii]|uniref:Uncharacterized protein n=1 Tax=Aspergillus keveii TaxID=714993 RepID=A0ABR4G6K1_9EURO